MNIDEFLSIGVIFRHCVGAFDGKTELRPWSVSLGVYDVDTPRTYAARRKLVFLSKHGWEEDRFQCGSYVDTNPEECFEILE